MFDDDEARRAILDLRQKVQIGEDQRRTMADQIDQLRRSLLDLNTRIDQQRDDNAKLRGQIEQLWLFTEPMAADGNTRTITD